MPGERWPDKRARAVLFAGARRHAAEGAEVDPDAVADTGLAVRETLFVDDEVREDNADPKANRIGYNRDCMQYATLEPSPDGLWLGLWLPEDVRGAAEETLGAAPDPNPFRKMYGWVRIPITPGQDVAELKDWVQKAVAHAAAVKKTGAKAAM